MDKIYNRFIRNIGAISQEEQILLTNKTVLVLGCGGLGGYVIEELVRLGVGRLIVFDGDRFDESNCNRQILATVDTLDMFKAEAAKQRAIAINPNINISSFNKRFDPNEDYKYIQESNVVVDCLDNTASKRILMELSKKANKTLVYGSVVSYQGQVSTILPTSKSTSLLYDEEALNLASSSLSFMVALIASIQVSEVLKVLLNKEPNLIDKMLIVDGDSLEFHVVSLSKN